MGGGLAVFRFRAGGWGFVLAFFLGLKELFFQGTFTFASELGLGFIFAEFFCVILFLNQILGEWDRRLHNQQQVTKG